MSLTEAQLEQRLDHVTGSDASIILGCSPWGNIIELWQEKLRLKEREDISHKPGVKAGNYLEPVVCQWFSDETSIQLEIDKNFLVHKEHKWMGGNIDRRVTGQRALFEAKTAGYAKGWGEHGENTIPDYYLCQIAHYVAVDDAELSYIAVLISGNDFRHYHYARNAKLEELIIKKEAEFWNCVQTETPPLPRTPDEVISLYCTANDGSIMIADEEIESMIDELYTIKTVVKEYQEKQKKFETNIKCFMKNRDILTDRSGRPIATWKNAKGAIRFDVKVFAEENEKLYEKYLKTSASSRRFLLK